MWWNPRSGWRCGGHRRRQRRSDAEAGSVALSWQICSWPRGLRRSCCLRRRFSPLVGVGGLWGKTGGGGSGSGGHGRRYWWWWWWCCSGGGGGGRRRRIQTPWGCGWWWCCLGFGTWRVQIWRSRDPFEAGEVGAVTVIWLRHSHRQDHGVSSQLHKQGNSRHLHVGEGANRWEAWWHCWLRKFYEHLRTSEVGREGNRVQKHTRVGICDARTCMLHMVNLKRPWWITLTFFNNFSS